MRVDFDANKNERNLKERGLHFAHAAQFDWKTAYIEEDFRKIHSERRLVAYGYLFGRFHICCFTPIAGGIRVISLRRGNKREERKYEKETANRKER